DVLAFDEALEKLEQHNQRMAELVKLRFFAGLTIAQTAQVLGISTSTADNDWAKLRGKKRPHAAIRKQIETYRERGYKPPQKRWAKTGWKQWQLDLLGTALDAELAARFGRSVNAVRVMRWQLGRRLP